MPALIHSGEERSPLSVMRWQRRCGVKHAEGYAMATFDAIHGSLVNEEISSDNVPGMPVLERPLSVRVISCEH